MYIKKEEMSILKQIHQVHSIRHLNETTFVLRLNRKDFDFTPGQYAHLGLPGQRQQREYSIYSPVQADYLEFLIKEIDQGYVSPRLGSLSPGDDVTIEGPNGMFMVYEDDAPDQSYYFIATGTGIAPFHSLAQSHPHLDYQLIHGVRTTQDCYESESYNQDRYIACVSREDKGNFQGHVTDYIKSITVDKKGLFYLCGNSDMIYDVFGYLVQQGIVRDQIFTEVYF